MRKKNQDDPLPLPGKRARDEGEAWQIEEQFKGRPCGWIQWKGTDVCMDVHCSCSYLGHLIELIEIEVRLDEQLIFLAD